jgi:hypothetical protein
MFKKLTLFSVLILFTFLGKTQDYSPVIRDGQFWTSFGSKADLSKRWQLSGEVAFRANNNWQSANSLFFETGLKWSKKAWSASGNYRAIEAYARKENRWFADVNYELKSSKRFDLDTRIRGQHSLYSDDKVAETYLRAKVKAKYNLKKNPLNPVADAEFYYNPYITSRAFEVFRWSVGLEFELIKDLDLSFMYRFEREFNVVAPQQSNILIVAFSHDFGKVYKKKKKSKEK